LKGKILWATGDLLIWAVLDLELKDSSGRWSRETFRVDSASDMTTMPAFAAKLFGLPIPRSAAPGAVHTQTGLEIRSGYLRARVVGMDQTEYAFPCLFLGDPDTPPSPNAPAAAVPRNLLGLAGVVNQLRITFDGDPVPPHAQYGTMTVEKKTP
jgi:hypothetical protein